MKTTPILIASLLLSSFPGISNTPPNPRPVPEFASAGFFNTQGSPRQAHDFNVGWRFVKGDPKGAQEISFDDSAWEIVNTPHGLELVPEEASGCSNYQGPAWYRKHFTAPESLRGKKVTLYFEALMGKADIYVNGRKIQTHLGGYLPAIVDVTDILIPGQENIVAVRVDNKNDPSYPPGKPQETLDFVYFGGIYRDVYLIETDPVHITDANVAGQEAGGGIFFRTLSATDDQARVGAKVHVANESNRERSLFVETVLTDSRGNKKGGYKSPLKLKPGASAHVDGEWDIKSPDLWSPDFPRLSRLTVNVIENGKVLDSQTIKVGIRHFVMNDQGFILNGKPFPGKLIGGNRHQDFAYLGNALPNIGQWRDAKKLRDAGLRVVRSAHYPQDPAFMDAADELGLFVIVATPGWQFWNKNPQFGELVYDNIRQMIRRDRNHPSVWVWEPILNETPYPGEFAQKAYETTHKEYPYPSCYAGCDDREAGANKYDLIYSHPATVTENTVSAAGPLNDSRRFKGKAYFTREWGDNVDDWGSHNSSSRVAREWGEIPMLIQANHYTNPNYNYTCWETLSQAPAYHIGGALWHPFDHQRGYHPDPFYGGIMDAFRQPKTSWYAFQAQRPADTSASSMASGPVVHIANDMDPFSPQDVTVFTNCDEVRLTAFEREPVTLKVRKEGQMRPGSTVLFPKAFDFMTLKSLTREGKGQQCYMLAEGLIDGKVVASHRVAPARRPSLITLTPDNEGIPLRANGTDMMVVIASITDKDGNVKRLNNEMIEFSIEGEGTIVGDASIGANPRAVQWGTAPVIIRSTTKSGKIKLMAKVLHPGAQKPASAVLELETLPPQESLIYKEVPGRKESGNSVHNLEQEKQLKEAALKKIDEVKKQQTASE